MSDTDEDRFRPKLGRLGHRGAAHSRGYLARVLRDVSALSGKGSGGTKGRGFSGARIGRGMRVMRRAKAGRSFGANTRRVIIKTRIVRIKGRGQGAVRSHLSYLQRDGVTREGARGQLYEAENDHVASKPFLERASGDRHQFRLIVAPEDAAELADLKPFIRDLMRAMEADLETRLDWLAVDHFNTGHPHSHIVIRGVDDTGADLVIARDYITTGMRHRASALLTRELGPVTEQELRRKYTLQITRDGVTDLDRALRRRAIAGVVHLRGKSGGAASRGHHAAQLGRLRVLATRGLAQELTAGRWQLADSMEDILRQSAERGDIIKTMHRALQRVRLEVGAADYAIYDPGDGRARGITGVVLDRGLHDEMRDSAYILLDASDGRVHYVALDPKQDMDDLPLGAFVAVNPASPDLKPADRAIVTIAARNDGVYTRDAHLEHDPTATEAFLTAHTRRLEALRRQNLVQRHPDGSWDIPVDLERRLQRATPSKECAPGQVKTLSYHSLERQITAGGATWLDRQLLAKEPLVWRGGRMAAAISEALRRRQEHLVSEGVVQKHGLEMRYPDDLLQKLIRQELKDVGAQLADRLQRPFVFAGQGAQFDGTYRRPLRLASGKYALLEMSDGFTLVPWRAALERQRGKHISVRMTGRSVSFKVVRTRGIGMG